MQDSEIEEARRADRRRIGAYGIVLLGAVCIVIATLYGLQPGDISEREREREPERTESVASEPSPLEDAPLQSEVLERASPPPEPGETPEPQSLNGTARATPEALDQSQTVDQEERDAFKKALRAFDNQLGDRLVGLPEPYWMPLQRDEILALRDESVSEFARGQYGTARDLLETAHRNAEEYFAARSADLDQAIAMVEAALRVDDLPGAEVGLEAASSIDPTDLRLPPLQKEVEALPELLGFLADIERARAERRPRDELVALGNALRIAPNRQDLTARLGEVREAVKEEDFARAIDDGLRSIDDRALEPAQAALEKAARLYRNRAETAMLKGEVEALGRRLSFEGHIRDAQAAARADDWTASLASLNSALVIEPADKDALQSKQLAQSIITTTNAINDLLGSPDRLALNSVAVKSETILKEAKTYGYFSPRLNAAADRLTETLEAYQQDVQVFIISDGETEIGVRGVGRVGKTTGRTIQLKPGAYVFEGAREGHISKLVELKVPPGAERVEVTVVTDERL